METNKSNSNSSENGKVRIILAGGGTGGHIFPAIAIANAIRQERPAAETRAHGAGRSVPVHPYSMIEKQPRREVEAPAGA